MTTIQLVAGQNYISFPETSPSNFDTILTDIRSIDPTLMLQRYSPMRRDFTTVNDFDFIEKGAGYMLTIRYPANLTYSGIPYILSFDNISLKLLDGWNLIGPGNIPISSSSWCTVIDPMTSSPTTILEPTKAYWINLNDCGRPVFNVTSALYTLGAISTVLFTIYLLGKFRIIGKPID